MGATGRPSAHPGVLPVPFPGTLGESPAEELVLGGNRAPEATATHQAPIKTPTAAQEEAPSPGTHHASPGPCGSPSCVCPGTGASGELPRAADQTAGHRRDRWVPELRSARTRAMPASAQVGSLLGTGRWTRGGTPEPPRTSLRSSQRLIRPRLHLPSTRGCPSLPAETAAAERAGALDAGGTAEELTHHLGLLLPQQVEIMVPGPTWWTGSSGTRVRAMGYSRFSAPPRPPRPRPRPWGQDWTTTRGSSCCNASL